MTVLSSKTHPLHGTRRGYVLGCRCYSCAFANSEYQREGRQTGFPVREPTQSEAMDLMAELRQTLHKVMS